MFDLFSDLEQAELILKEGKGTCPIMFDSIDDFHLQLKDELFDLQHQNIPNFENILIWFAPTSLWGSVLGDTEKELANRICKRAERWNKAVVK